jgi:hypothetical protein
MRAELKMSDPSLSELIASYRAHCLTMKATDYGSKRSVNAHNAAATASHAIGQEIGARGEGAIRTFAELLNDDDPQVTLWSAHTLVGAMSPPDDVKERALEVIRERARGEGFEAFTQRLWLEEHGKRSSNH